MGGSDASSSPELHPSSAELEFLDAVTFPSMDVIGDYTMDVEPSGIDSEANESGLNNSESNNSNQESNATSSSKLTSSDKLSALPTSPNPNMSPRLARSPLLGSGRAYRRSMDASTSLPSFSTGELDASKLSPPISQSWNNLGNTNFPSHAAYASASDGSIGKDTAKRVSFDSDRASLPTMQSVKQAFSRKNRGSDPTVPSPALRSSAAIEQKNTNTLDTPPNQFLGSRSPSHSHSRATSPFRAFQQWSAGLRSHHHHGTEDPFVPVDPFQLKSHFTFRFRLPRIPCLPSSRALSIKTPDTELGSRRHVDTGSMHAYDCAPQLAQYTISFRTFMTDTVPRFVYLYILLRLPAIYFSRVARIFQDAEVSKPDIQRMIDSAARNGNGNGFNGAFDDVRLGASVSGAIPQGLLSTSTAAAAVGLAGAVGPLPSPEDWTPPLVSPALVRFKISWEGFIDSLMREWKTLNVVSALLLSAILTMFQIPEAAEDPVTRNAALLSLICALMSLTYGCMYIVRFGTMRSMYRASRWAEEARKTNTLIWWNVWTLLAMPSVWLAWSMVFFVASILSFVWRTGSVLDPQERPPLGAKAALGPRIAITCLFGLGMIYFALIVRTLKSYGTHAGRKGAQWARARDVLEARRRGGGGVDDAAGSNAAARGGEISASRADVDSAMGRRGRERERNTSRGVRKREEPKENRASSMEGAGSGSGSGSEGESGEKEKERDKDKSKESSLMKMAMGLGLSGMGAVLNRDSGVVVDLEKGLQEKDTSD